MRNSWPGARELCQTEVMEVTPTTRASRSKMLSVGVPAVLVVASLGGVSFLLGGGGDDVVRTGDVATTASSSTTIADEVFTSGGVTVESSAAPTTRPSTTRAPTTRATTTTTTTIAPTTTAAPVQQLSQPVAPPADPRGYEEKVELGGISIPKIGLEAPLLEGIRLTTLDAGPGHWPGTAMPGEVGNVVVAAHRTSHRAEFRHIDQLVPGDVVMFDTAAGESEYRVTGTQIVGPDAIWIVDQTDTPTATLFACHPPGSVRQRIVVNLELAD